MGWRLAAAVLLLAASYGSAFTLIEQPINMVTLPSYTCSQTPSYACSRGTCPAGRVCSGVQSPTHAGCECVETTTTTLRRCQLDQSGLCAGYCSKGSVCSMEYGKCGCYAPTTTTLRACQADPKTGRCYGACPQGAVCSGENGKCGCYGPTTTTRQTTTTTLRAAELPTAGACSPY